ncbi:unnamed protein product, partial [Closterium sp. NIES-53]
ALGVMFEERDVSMRVHFRQELKTLMGSASLSVPHLFVRGRYIGGADDVQQLHDQGLLVSILEGLPINMSPRDRSASRH